MCWFKQKHPHKPQRLTAPTVKFLGEQDGVPERELKVCFVELFRKQLTVERAYLAFAEHADAKDVHVTLAIRCSSGDDPALIPKPANIFSSMFGSHEHLDIMFIKEDEERQLQGVCRPFYERAD